MKDTNRIYHNKQGSLLDKPLAYFYNHSHALVTSLGHLFSNRTTAIMTIMVMAIAISLASGFYLLVVNVQQLTGKIAQSNELSLFLKPNVSDSTGEQLAQQLRADRRLSKVVLIGKEQALQEFKTYSGFGEALAILDGNPLPVVIQVSPQQAIADLAALETLVAEFKQLVQVDFVQLDRQWIERLQSIMQLMQRGVLLLSVLLAVAVLFITGNTIRLELHNRRDEVLIAKLVGATHTFIQRPFLYTGFWLGLLSGSVAWLLVMLMVSALQHPLERLSTLYDGAFTVLYLGPAESIIVVLVSAFLGVLGAWSVLHYQLQQIRPE